MSKSHDLDRISAKFNELAARLVVRGLWPAQHPNHAPPARPQPQANDGLIVVDYLQKIGPC